MNSPKTHREAHFTAEDGLRLYAQAVLPAAPRAAVAFIHGYRDHSSRYRELLDRLAAAGYAAYALDYRGHGKSEGRRGYIDRFDEYLGDLDLFLRQVRQEAEGAPHFLVGHSHGGLLLARLLQEGIDRPTGAVFASPYLGLALRPSRLKRQAALALGRIFPWLPVPSGILPWQLTRDPGWQRASATDPMLRPLATPRWFIESSAAQEAALARAAEITTPTLVLLPEADPIADPAVGRRFFETVGARDKVLIEYNEARHELFHEIQETREQVFTDLIQWLDARCEPAAG